MFIEFLKFQCIMVLVNLNEYSKGCLEPSFEKRAFFKGHDINGGIFNRWIEVIKMRVSLL